MKAANFREFSFKIMATFIDIIFDEICRFFGKSFCRFWFWNFWPEKAHTTIIWYNKQYVGEITPYRRLFRTPPTIMTRRNGKKGKRFWQHPTDWSDSVIYLMDIHVHQLHVIWLSDWIKVYGFSVVLVFANRKKNVKTFYYHLKFSHCPTIMR